MAKLNNQEIVGGFTANLKQSFGPYLSLDGESFIFDTRPREFPLWLGYNASPLFGLLQHLETWTGNRSDSLERIETAYTELTQRLDETHSGKLQLHPAQTLKPAGLLYNYISLSILDQFPDEHNSISQEIERQFHQVADKFGDLIKDSYVNGTNFEFGFELQDEFRNRFSVTRAGILTTPWPRLSHKYGFHLNLSYRENEMELFWQRLNLLFRNLQNDSVEYSEVGLGPPAHLESHYEFHESLIRAKVTRKLPKKSRFESFLTKQLKTCSSKNLRIVVLDQKSYQQYREHILRMQREVYEPARQSPPEEFDMLFSSEKPLGILVLDGETIVAMSFAGRLELFRQERGVTGDPFFGDSHTYYSMDLTVASEFRGGLGRIMKQAMVLLAIENGVTALHGRNRDRLARGMWAINLSLGSYELQHLPNDYPDDGPYRDCIYYRCPLEWDELDLADFDLISDSISAMVNGLLLKNVIIENEPTT